MNITNKDIYSMELHEFFMVGDVNDSLATTVLRVPGGWVYSQFDKSHNISSSVFVRFDNEFQVDTQSDDPSANIKA